MVGVSIAMALTDLPRSPMSMKLERMSIEELMIVNEGPSSLWKLGLATA
jgi:hypothetical protein